MQVIKQVEQMRRWSESQRSKGLTVGCVPTMGFLHEGHLSLLRECSRRADRVVMTLFVNPSQFSAGEDYEDYPRDFEGDCKNAEQCGADVAFAPSVEEMYPEGYQTYVSVTEVSRDMEGAIRFGHFPGVVTIVTKLFNAVLPHLAVFGEKDYQQLKVIERLVEDLNMGVEIAGLPTVREDDGMAMSSRNVYLSGPQRQQALAISRSLFEARQAVQNGERESSVLRYDAAVKIKSAGMEVDYVAVRDSVTLEPLVKIDRPARMLIAARLGSIRLIDNMQLFPG